ncbi:MAG: DUF167 family protein [Hyphomicrobiaceae bacterium]
MTGASERVWWQQDERIAIRVRLTPKGGRDAMDGLTTTSDGPALKARVRAVPEDGAANAALETLLAGWLGCAKRDVAVAAGHKSRIKTVLISGPPAQTAARLGVRIASLNR